MAANGIRTGREFDRRGCSPGPSSRSARQFALISMLDSQFHCRSETACDGVLIANARRSGNFEFAQLRWN